jgi:hypothetical protein
MTDVVVRPGVLAWSAERGCITAANELLAAVREGEVVLAVDDDYVVRAVEGEAPLAAVVRGDNDTARLIEKIRHLNARADDVHDRLVDVAEASIAVLTRR